MKNVFKNLLFIIIGISALLLSINQIVNFTPHDYFYEGNPGIKYYVGVNVVSRFAEFSFFTCHTIILFGIWFVAYGMSSLFDLKRIIKFLKNKSLLTFLFTNYLITSLLYTIFELTSGNITFGLYADTPKAIYNFITNIIGHYLFFIIMLITYIKIIPNGEYQKKTNILMSLYIFIYYWYVLITGKFMYKIEWYPYPIFDTFALFKVRLEPYIEIPIMFLISLILTIGYYFLLKIMLIIKDKQVKNFKNFE